MKESFYPSICFFKKGKNYSLNFYNAQIVYKYFDNQIWNSQYYDYLVLVGTINECTKFYTFNSYLYLLYKEFLNLVHHLYL